MSGDLAVFIDPDSDITAVWFWLDDTGFSPPADNSDNASPFDYVGGTASTATMWDTTTVADGAHTMSVRIRHTDSTIETVTVTFTVDNSSSGFPLWWINNEAGPSGWARPAQSKPVNLAALLFQATGGSEVVSETFYYRFGGELIGMRVDGDLSFIVGDRLGSTSAVYNTVTNAVSQRWFEPFGQPRYTSGTIDTDIGFTGQRADAESWLMFYNARYYDPTIGRFISQDSIVPDPANPQDLNRYTYVRNNPANFLDPTGNEPDQTYGCPGIMFECTSDVKSPEAIARYDRWKAENALPPPKWCGSAECPVVGSDYVFESDDEAIRFLDYATGAGSALYTFTDSALNSGELWGTYTSRTGRQLVRWQEGAGWLRADLGINVTAAQNLARGVKVGGSVLVVVGGTFEAFDQWAYDQGVYDGGMRVFRAVSAEAMNGGSAFGGAVAGTLTGSAQSVSQRRVEWLSNRF